MSQNQFGQLKQIDFFDNVGGTNLVDSVFKIKENQAAGGYNFDYVLTGGIRKRPGAPKVNSSPDTGLYSRGFGLYAPTSSTTTKSLFRAAGSKLQLVDTALATFTPLSQDTLAATTNAFSTSNAIQDVQFVQFSTGTTDILWGSGGGAALPVGAYSTTKYTQNGIAAPVGTFTKTVNAHGGGSWASPGNYVYSFVYHKAGTSVISNAAKDIAFTIVNSDDTVTIHIPASPDTTLIDKVWIYRSAISGVTGFTTGSLVAQVNSSATSFIDLGDIGNPDILSVDNVPRAANLVLDNSPLPTGSYNTLALWGHRLCTSSGNSLYISDVNKSESWPLVNYINIPSAGPITALSTISFTSPQANSLQELLVIYKERELWVLTPGSASDYTTWSLLKVDATVGCSQQALVVQAQGYLAWIDYRGVWLWDGTSKPIYCSRLIEPLFGTSGDLDKGKLNEACGAFFKRENQIIWYLSSKTYGEQTYAIKMDMRLTLAGVDQTLTGRTIDGVLIQDVHANPVYAALSYVPTDGANEQMILGDNAGYCYLASNGFSDGGSDISFKYLTAPIHAGNPNTKKLFHTVIVWVQDLGDWNLYLDYWADFQMRDDFKTTMGLPISTKQQQTAVWDIALFDLSYWDSYIPDAVPLIFNLQSGNVNSTQGSAIQLQFRNDLANQPISIHGFTLVYSELGGVSS